MASVGVALDVEISHLVFRFLWPFVFSSFSRVRFPLAACFAPIACAGVLPASLERVRAEILHK